MRREPLPCGVLLGTLLIGLLMWAVFGAAVAAVGMLLVGSWSP